MRQVGDFEQGAFRVLRALIDDKVVLEVSANFVENQINRPGVARTSKRGNVRYLIHPPAVEKISTGAVFWQKDSCDSMYRKKGVYCVFMPKEALFGTVAEWIRFLLGVPASATAAELIYGMWNKMIYEDGITCAGGQPRTFRAPNGYVPFEEKLVALRSRTDWEEPPSWINGKPTAADFALIAKYPPAVDDMGDTANGTIEGSGWYAIVILDLNASSAIVQDLKVEKVAICVEQFARTSDGNFVGWAFDHLDVKYTGIAGGGDSHEARAMEAPQGRAGRSRFQPVPGLSGGGLRLRPRCVPAGLR